MIVKDLFKLAEMIDNKVDEIINCIRDAHNEPYGTDIADKLLRYAMELLNMEMKISVVISHYCVSYSTISDEDMEYLDVLDLNKLTEQLYKDIDKIRSKS